MKRRRSEIGGDARGGRRDGRGDRREAARDEGRFRWDSIIRTKGDGCGTWGKGFVRGCRGGDSRPSGGGAARASVSRSPYFSDRRWSRVELMKMCFACVEENADDRRPIFVNSSSLGLFYWRSKFGCQGNFVCATKVNESPAACFPGTVTGGAGVGTGALAGTFGDARGVRTERGTPPRIRSRFHAHTAGLSRVGFVASRTSTSRTSRAFN